MLPTASSANRGKLTAVNTTFAGNSAANDGGAIANGGNLVMRLSTFSDNSAGGLGRGLLLAAGTASMASTIVDNGVDNNCGGSAVIELISGGNNIDRGTTCGLAATGDRASTDPRLGGLTAAEALNGVPTVPLRGTSPAIDHAGTSCGTSDDARGFPRPVGAGCDIGAREEVQTDLAVVISDSPDPVVVGEVLTYSITVGNNGPGTARDVVLTTSVPEGAGLVDMVPSQGTCSGDPSLRCGVGALAPGASATIELKVRPTAPGSIEQYVEVSCEMADTLRANNKAKTITIVSESTPGDPAPGDPAPTPATPRRRWRPISTSTWWRRTASASRCG